MCGTRGCCDVRVLVLFVLDLSGVVGRWCVYGQGSGLHVRQKSFCCGDTCALCCRPLPFTFPQVLLVALRLLEDFTS